MKTKLISRLVCVLAGSFTLGAALAQQPFDPARGIVLHGTVVTMDAGGTILHNGNVMVRDGRIVAAWQGANPPRGTQVGDAVQVDIGSQALVFPGLINLHNHLTYDMLELWPAPSSHLEPGVGRPLGTEPYANRYQWNGMMTWSARSPEFRRLVDTPQTLLNSPIGLNLYPEVGKYAEVKAMLGGETALQGGQLTPESITY